MEKTNQKRQSYTREFKLSVVSWYFKNGKNISKTYLEFKVDRKQVRTWVAKEPSIRATKIKRRCERVMAAKFPDMEKHLHTEFLKLKKEGRSVKKWWFVTTGREFLKNCHLDAKFLFSDKWFRGFCNRKRISLRRKTNASQKTPDQLVNAITKFHQKLLCERIRGKFQLKDIANMDQTPLPFVLDDSRTYDTVGAKEMLVRSGQSGLDKRQCTVHLTVFGDGVCRLRPTLIFRGKGLRISKEEKSNWDKRVKVFFQEKAWCDQTIMKCWINEEWGNMFFNPANPESSGKIVCADVHRAQQTATVKRMLQSKNTVLVNIPPGCASKVQPLDVSINKPFKDYLRTQFEKYRDENIELYISNNLTASKR